MGGIHSGKRAETPDTDDCLILSLSDLRRLGLLKRHQWARKEMRWTRYDGRQVTGSIAVTADIDCRAPTSSLTIEGWGFGEKINQRLEIVAQPQPFGGERFYAICPITGRRCITLILPPGKRFFASVPGWEVPYTSGRERGVDRAVRKIFKAEEQLQALSKYTRKPTRERLWQQWLTGHEVYDAWEERVLAMW